MKGRDKISKATCRILVVDDDTYIAEFFGAFFDNEKYEVNVAADVEIGQKEVSKGNYDVLFLDVYLPGADGLDMLKEVKKAVDLGKVVVITGEVTTGLRKRVTDLGIQKCLGKPFDLDEIREIVNSVPVSMNDGTRNSNHNTTRVTKRLHL
jgi:DNA-binding response OmpR family regulator